MQEKYHEGNASWVHSTNIIIVQRNFFVLCSCQWASPERCVWADCLLVSHEGCRLGSSHPCFCLLADLGERVRCYWKKSHDEWSEKKLWDSRRIWEDVGWCWAVEVMSVERDEGGEMRRCGKQEGVLCWASGPCAGHCPPWWFMESLCVNYLKGKIICHAALLFFYHPSIWPLEFLFISASVVWFCFVVFVWT